MENACSLCITGAENVEPMHSISTGTPITSTSPLYIFAGSTRCETMNLYVQCLPVPQIDTSQTLAITGSSTNVTGMFRAIPLQIIGHSLSEMMNLVIQGKDSGGQSKLIRLTIRGGDNPIDGMTPLVIVNDSNFYDDPTTSLFIQGLGQNPGYKPTSQSIGLYIQRGPYDGITLFIQNNNIGRGISLNIIGASSYNDSVPMFIEGFGGTNTGIVPLTVMGDVFQEWTNSATLVISNVVGFEAQIAYLYTNGFEY